MKQSPVEWLIEQLKKPDKRNLLGTSYCKNAIEQAKKMEAEERDKIYDHAFKYGQLSAPQLSDEEIKEIAKQHLRDRSATNIYYWLIEGMQLYREQLKQRQ